MSGNSEGSGPNFINLNALTVSGPGVNKRVKRRLMRTRLNHEQVSYLDHRGAYDPHARVRDLDLMGIDQVLVIPTMLINNFYFVENPQGAAAFARAYNSWVHDWCKAQPQRLFPAAIFALQNVRSAVEEIYRVAKLGFRVVLLRPIDAAGLYPNRLEPGPERSSSHGKFGPNYTDALFRAIEETGMVLGIAYLHAAAGRRHGGTREADLAGRPADAHRSRNRPGDCRLDLQLYLRSHDLACAGAAVRLFGPLSAPEDGDL